MWGPEGMGARGVGRAFVWMLATAAIIAVGRLLALSSPTVTGQPRSPQHQSQQRPIESSSYAAIDTTGPIGTIGSSSTAPAACPITAGTVDAGWCPKAAPREGGGGSGDEASGRRPSIITPGAEDLVGLSPHQLVEQVLEAREAAAHAVERADAAERAARLGIGFLGGLRRVPGEEGGGGDARSDGRWRVFGGGDSGGGGEHEQARGSGGAPPPPPDGAAEELASRNLLASAVEDFSSAIEEFSEVSRTWLEQVAGGDSRGDASESTVLRLRAQDPASSVRSVEPSASYVDWKASGEQLLPPESTLQQSSWLGGNDALAPEAEQPRHYSSTGEKHPPLSSGGPSAPSRPLPGSDIPGDSNGNLLGSVAPPSGMLQQRVEHGDRATEVPVSVLASLAADEVALPDSERPERLASDGGGGDGTALVVSGDLSDGAARVDLVAVSAGGGVDTPLSHAAAFRQTMTTPPTFLAGVVGDAEQPPEGDFCPLEALDVGSEGGGATLLGEELVLGRSAVREAGGDPGASPLQDALVDVLGDGDSGEGVGSVESGGAEETTAAKSGAAAAAAAASSAGGSGTALGDGDDAAAGTCDTRSAWAAWAGGDDELVGSPALGDDGDGDAAAAVRAGGDRTPGASADGDAIDPPANTPNNGGEFSVAAGGRADSTIETPRTARPVTDTDDPVAVAPASAAAGAAAVAPSPSSATAGDEPAVGVVLERAAATPVPVGALLGTAWSAPPSWVASKPKAAEGGAGFGFHRAMVGAGRAERTTRSAARAEMGQSAPEGFKATATALRGEANNGDVPDRGVSNAEVDSPSGSGTAERSPASASGIVDAGHGADGGGAGEGKTDGEKSRAPAVEEEEAASPLGAEAAVADPDEGGGGGGSFQGEDPSVVVVETPPFVGAEAGCSALSPASSSACAYSEQAEEADIAVVGGAVSNPSDGSGGVADGAGQRPVPAGGATRQTDASATPDVPPAANGAGSVPTGDDAGQAPPREDTVSLRTESNLQASEPPPPPLRLPDINVATVTAAADQATLREAEALAAEAMVTAVPRGEDDGTGAALSGGTNGIDGTGAVAGNEAGAAPAADAPPTGGEHEGTVEGNGDVDGNGDVVANGDGGGGGGEAPGGDGEGVAATAAAAAAADGTLANGGEEVPSGAAPTLVDKEKKQDREDDEEAQEKPTQLGQGAVGSLAADEGTGEEEDHSRGGGSKGWWARASDRRKAKAEEKALRRARKSAAAARKHDFEQLQDSKRLAILEAEEREKQLRLLDEMHLRAPATASATSPAPSAFAGDGGGAAAAGRKTEPGVENAPPEAAVETLQADDAASAEQQGQAGARAEAVAFRPQQEAGDESDHSVNPEEMDTDQTDHPTGGSEDPASARVGNAPGSFAGNEHSHGEHGEEDEGGEGRQRSLLQQRHERGQKNQEYREEPAKGPSREKKSGGKRARGIIGAIAAAAYYAVWVAVALVLG